MKEGKLLMSDKKERIPVLYRLALYVVPLFYRIFWKLTIIGKENIPESGAVIIASSHVSNRDPVFLASACKRQIHYMAKSSLFTNKLFGAIIRYAGAFPVERGTGGADALQKAYDLLNEKRIVGVFIEGTRSQTGELLRPKNGISLLEYKTKAPVIPVAIIGEGGKCPVRKKKVTVNIGKAIYFDELGMLEDNSTYYRKASKQIMEKISDLRTQAIELMDGVQ
jgi:1-acyl-sn-glycerol-3-phosphate acyltransferase